MLAEHATTSLKLRIQVFCQRVIFKLDRMRQQGLLHNIKRGFRHVALFILAISLLPLSFVIYAMGFKRLIIFTDRIGHLATEPDTILKEQKLGRIKAARWIVLAPSSRVSNQHLLDYWKPFFTVVQSKFYCFVLEALTYWRFVRYNASYAINRLKGAQEAYVVNAAWGDRPSLLTLSDEDEVYADDMLQQLGLPKDAWFVCVHAREGGFSKIDESIHWHRNGNIENLMPSIKEITSRGGWVVRLGDPSTKPMDKMDKVIDYAHHPLRSARLDIILCARTKFILGNTSGIFLVGYLFGTPSALVNMIPFPTLGLFPQDISIPKLYRDPKTNRYLSFGEIMETDISLYRYADLYKKCGLIVEENSAEDILAVTKEMLARIDGSYQELAEDKVLHDQYMDLFKPRHYSYQAGSKISFEFLRNHRDLLLN